MTSVAAPPKAPALPVWRSVGQSFAILSGNLPSIMTLYAPMIVAWLLIALMQTGLKPENPAAAVTLYCLLGVAMAAAALVAAMALQIATLRNLENGTFPVGEACAQALPRLLPFMLLTVIFAVLSLATMALLVVPFLFVFPMIFVAPMVWLAERCTILDAFHRSAALTRGYRWRILGIFAVVCLIALAIDLAATIPGKLAGTAEILAAETVAQLLSLLLHLVATILVAVVYARLTSRQPANPAAAAAA